MLTSTPDASPEWANSTDPCAVREKDDRKEHDGSQKQTPIDNEQDAQDAEELDDCPPWVVAQPEDEVPDRARIFTDKGSGAATAQLMDAVQRQGSCVQECMAPNGDLDSLRGACR